MELDEPPALDASDPVIVAPVTSGVVAEVGDDAHETFDNLKSGSRQEEATGAEHATLPPAMAVAAETDGTSGHGVPETGSKVFDAAEEEAPNTELQSATMDIESNSVPVAQPAGTADPESVEMEIDPATSPLRSPSASIPVQSDAPRSQTDSPGDHSSREKLDPPASLQVDTRVVNLVKGEQEAEEEEEEEEVEMVEERTPSGKRFALKMSEVGEVPSQPLPAIQEAEETDLDAAIPLRSTDAEPSQPSPGVYGDPHEESQDPESEPLALQPTETSTDHVMAEHTTTVVEDDDTTAAIDSAEPPLPQGTDTMVLGDANEAAPVIESEAVADAAEVEPVSGPSTPRQPSPQVIEDPSKLFMGHRFWVDLKRPDRRDLIRRIKVRLSIISFLLNVRLTTMQAAGGALVAEHETATHVLVHDTKSPLWPPLMKQLAPQGIWFMRFVWVLKCMEDSIRYPELGHHVDGGALSLSAQVSPSSRRKRRRKEGTGSLKRDFGSSSRTGLKKSPESPKQGQDPPSYGRRPVWCGPNCAR